MSTRKKPDSVLNKKVKEPRTSKKIIKQEFLFMLDNTRTKVFVVVKECSIHTDKVELNLLNKKHFSETDLNKFEFSRKHVLHKNCIFHFIKAHLYLIKQTIEIESLRKIIKLEPGEYLYEVDYDEHRKPKGRRNLFYQSVDLDLIKADFRKTTLMHKFLIYGIDAYKKYLKTK